MGCRVASAGLLRIEAVDWKRDVVVPGSIRGGAVGLAVESRRAIIAPPRTTAIYPICCPGGLRRRQEMGWHGALVVCGFSVLDVCVLGIDLRSAEGQSPPTRGKGGCKRGVAGRQGSLWPG